MEQVPQKVGGWEEASRGRLVLGVGLERHQTTVDDQSQRQDGRHDGDHEAHGAPRARVGVQRRHQDGAEDARQTAGRLQQAHRRALFAVLASIKTGSDRVRTCQPD